MDEQNVTAKDLAWLFEPLSTRRIYQLRDAKIVIPSKKGFLLLKSVKGYILYLTQRQGGEKAQERLAHLKADITAIQLQKLQGSVQDTAQVEKDAYEVGRMTRDALFNIPPRIASIVAAETDSFKIEQILLGEIRQATEKLSGDDGL